MTLIPVSPLVLEDDPYAAAWAYIAAVQNLVFNYHWNAMLVGEEKAQAIYDADLAELRSQLTL